MLVVRFDSVWHRADIDLEGQDWFGQRGEGSIAMSDWVLSGGDRHALLLLLNSGGYGSTLPTLQ